MKKNTGTSGSTAKKKTVPRAVPTIPKSEQWEAPPPLPEANETAKFWIVYRNSPPPHSLVWATPFRTQAEADKFIEERTWESWAMVIER
jgi:hypothetical protein